MRGVVLFVRALFVAGSFLAAQDERAPRLATRA